MVAMGMGWRRQSLAWCVVVLVAGLLLAAAEADHCTKHCGGQVDLWGCAGRCRSQLEVAQQLSSFCGDYCRREEPNVDYRYCVRRCEFGPRRRSHHHLHLPAGAGGSSRRGVDVLKVADCEKLCHDQPDQEWCLYRCYYGAHARRASLHLKLAGRKSATQQEGSRGGGAANILTKTTEEICKLFCHELPQQDYDWCFDFCMDGEEHLKLAGGEGTASQEEEASGRGAVDVLAMTKEEICKLFCHEWPQPDHDWCFEFCMDGEEHLKVASRESMIQEEEASGGAVHVRGGGGAA